MVPSDSETSLHDKDKTNFIIAADEGIIRKRKSLRQSTLQKSNICC